MSTCTFCRLYKAREVVVYENELFFAQFDKFPVSPGHTEIIPKRHIASLFELTQEEWELLQPMFTDVKRVIETTDFSQVYKSYLADPLNDTSAQFCETMLQHEGVQKRPDAYTIGINEGEAAGRTVHHLHIHLIPRFYGDVPDHIGCIRHIIPGMGNYKK